MPSRARPLVIPTIEALRPYAAGTDVDQVTARGKYRAEEIVKLASNENPLGCGVAARLAAERACGSIARYADPSAPRLSAAIAGELGVSPSEIVLGNGSNELLDLAVRTFCTPDGHVVFGEPAFVVYRLAAMAHGVPVSAVPLRDWVHDLDAMLAAVTDRTQVVFVANPNNPTGTHVPGEALRAFLERLPEQVVAVVDEAYLEYALAGDFVSALEMRGAHENLIVTRTFSKIHGLAALRVGYGVMPARLASYMHRVRAPFNVNAVAQAAALAALGDREHVSRSREMNRRGKELLRVRLEELGLGVVPSEANFLLALTQRSGQALYEALLDHAVIVRAIPPIPNAVRITIGTPSENERLVAALATVLSA